MTNHIIRTSDRGMFKRCRQLWDFTSKIRQDWEPDVSAKPLEFGTAIHRGLEAYYDPTTWQAAPSLRAALALKHFADVIGDQKQKTFSVSGGGVSVEVETEYKEREELGRGMLEYYFKWAKANDNFEPVRVEVEFELPIPVPDDVWLYKHNGIQFSKTRDGYLQFQGELVVYQGRIDLIIQNEDGLWIVDHKTAAQFADTRWLALDDQCSGYFWALDQMGFNIRGVIYNELIKKVPHPPKLNQNGTLSVNKQQDTTLDLFMEAVRAGGFQPSAYGSYIEYLRENPKQFVRRTFVPRNRSELERIGRQVVLEAIDMLGEPAIYPNPSRMNCNGCQFFAPCIATAENSDVQTILDGNYRKREHVDH